MAGMCEAFTKAIDLAGSQSELARRIGGKVRQQHISAWLQRGKVPEDQVLSVARAVAFQVTPHELDSAMYPDPEDGMPRHLRDVETPGPVEGASA